MKPYLAMLFFIFASFLNAESLNTDALEHTIIKYNQEGKQKVSLQKLSDVLLSADLTDEEEGHVLFLMASTYRSANDYLLCIEYLHKSLVFANQLPKDNLLRMRIDYEFAFVHFDNRDYKKSSQAMKHISDQHYKKALPEDEAYILMQEGYLLLLDHEYDTAEKKYNQALAVLRRVSYCNVPLVMAKMMELYNRQRDIDKVERLYKEGEKISERCGILKYEVFLTAEMERIYKENNRLDKAYMIGLNLDSLRKLENQGGKISEMHMIDNAYLARKEGLQSELNFWEKIGALFVAAILLSIILFSVFKTKGLKNDKIKMEEEIEQMKQDLEHYSQRPHSGEKFVNPEEVMANSDKLTERQKELLSLMTDGLSNKEIAEKLFITESTVKYHIKNIYSILEIKDRKDLFKKIINQ